MHIYAHVFYRRYLIASPFLRLDLSRVVHRRMAPYTCGMDDLGWSPDLRWSTTMFIISPDWIALRTAALRLGCWQQST
jgi:hypothetical protein